MTEPRGSFQGIIQLSFSPSGIYRRGFFSSGNRLLKALGGGCAGDVGTLNGCISGAGHFHLMCNPLFLVSLAPGGVSSRGTFFFSTLVDGRSCFPFFDDFVLKKPTSHSPICSSVYFWLPETESEKVHEFVCVDVCVFRKVKRFMSLCAFVLTVLVLLGRQELMKLCAAV